MWTDEEIEFLFENTNMSILDIAQALEKTTSAVRSKRSRLKIRSGDSTNLWTAEERRILQEHYGTKTSKEFEEILPNRSWNSIRSQAYYLRCRHWNI